MKQQGKTILKSTDGGLNIFKHYVKNSFELNETVVVDTSTSFKIFWSENYNNYVISINTPEEKYRYNAIWFVKEKYDLSEDETYIKIKHDLKLNDNQESNTNKMGLDTKNPLNLILK